MNKESDYPEFDGDPARYRAYRVAVRWLEASVRAEHQHLVAPALVRKLKGVAVELFRDKDPSDFRCAEGVTNLLEILDVHYNYLPETELQDAIEDDMGRLLALEKSRPPQHVGRGGRAVVACAGGPG